jgi:TonB family protein
MNKIARCFVSVAFALFWSSGPVNALDQSSADEPPAVVSAVAPYYPPIALAAHPIGRVVVQVTIDPGGAVTAANAVSGHPLLQKACEVTAKRWRFIEAKDSHSARQTWLTFVFSFRADKKGASEAERDLITFTPPYPVEVTRNADISLMSSTNLEQLIRGHVAEGERK